MIFFLATIGIGCALEAPRSARRQLTRTQGMFDLKNPFDSRPGATVAKVCATMMVECTRVGASGLVQRRAVCLYFLGRGGAEARGRQAKRRFGTLRG